jgi:hypothetical protein
VERSTINPNPKETAMKFEGLRRFLLQRRGLVLTAVLVSSALAAEGQTGRSTLVMTSTNDANSNAVVVFQLKTGGTPTLSLARVLPTGGKGGASGNAGIVQFDGELGAVANYGSNTVTELARYGNGILPVGTIRLAPECQGPDSVALGSGHVFVVGTNCAESHAWPRGNLDGSVVSLADNSAAQIAAGKTWAAVTLKSGSVLQLPLTGEGELSGVSNTITLPAEADNTPLGEAFWGDVLGFTPAHSADSFAIANAKQDVYPIVGPAPAFPTNAPCWVAKGPKSLWYTGNSPGQAISIFFSDDEGGVFYKSVPVPGVPTDIAVSPDKNWLAVIYTAGDGAHVGVFAIDEHGDLTHVANSAAMGVAAFNGVAFSQ